MDTSTLKNSDDGLGNSQQGIDTLLSIATLHSTVSMQGPRCLVRLGGSEGVCVGLCDGGVLLGLLRVRFTVALISGKQVGAGATVSRHVASHQQAYGGQTQDVNDATSTI